MIEPGMHERLEAANRKQGANARYSALIDCAEKIRQYVPTADPDAPPYEGPEAYLDAARDFMTTQILGSLSVASVHEAISELDASNHIRRWGARHEEEMNGVYKLHQTRPMQFRAGYWNIFTDSVKAFTLLPEKLCQQSYEVQLEPILREIPQKLRLRTQAIRSGKLPVERLRQLVSQAEALPHSMSLPNFHTLTEQEQSEVVDAIGEDALAFWGLLGRYTNKTQRELHHHYPAGAILHRPVAQLEEVLKASPANSDVFAAFLDEGDAFGKYHTTAKPKADQVNEQKSNLEIVGSLQPGDIYELCEKDEILSLRHTEQAVRMFVDMLATHLQGDNPTMTRARWEATNSDMVAQLIDNKFNGQIKNVRMMMLEVTDEFLRRVTTTGIDRTKMRRIALMADLHSGGRASLPASVDMGIYIHDIGQMQRPALFKTTAKKVTGKTVIDDLIAESRAVAEKTGRLTVRARRVASGDRNVHQNNPAI